MRGTPRKNSKGVDGIPGNWRCLVGHIFHVAWGRVRVPFASGPVALHIFVLTFDYSRRMFAEAQRGMDCDAAHALFRPAGDELAKRLDGGNRAACPARLTDHRRNLGRPRAAACRRTSRVSTPACVVPPLSAGPSAARVRYRGRNRPGASAPGLSILEHLESPAPHRCSPWTKVPERSGNARRFEMPVIPSTGSNTPISDWLHYGDHQVAPICRSHTGSYMPITEWLQYADRRQGGMGDCDGRRISDLRRDRAARDARCGRTPAVDG